MEKNEELYQDDDVNNFIDIVDRFKDLQDTEYSTAYRLHKDALGVYDRWSLILFEVRRAELIRKKDPALKDRIEHILKVSNNIYTSARMVWNKSKDDLSEGKY